MRMFEKRNGIRTTLWLRENSLNVENCADTESVPMARSKLGSLARNLLRYFSIKQTPTEPAKQNICLDEVSEHDCIIVQLPRSNENICINSSTN